MVTEHSCCRQKQWINMVKAMREANLPSFGCFAHSLQLVVNDGLLSQCMMKYLLSVCRSIVGHFKQSNVLFKAGTNSRKP